MQGLVHRISTCALIVFKHCVKAGVIELSQCLGKLANDLPQCVDLVLNWRYGRHATTGWRDLTRLILQT